MRILAASVLFFASSAWAQDAAIEGRWANPDGSVIIDIAPCGAAHCGTVAWASNKAKADARKGTDRLVGTELLAGFEEKKRGQWSGRVFIPDHDMRAKAKLQLVGERQLKVSGCVAVVLCRTQYWNRADGPLPN
jgi:uncharacterized protein (DUF2147 family)